MERSPDIVHNSISGAMYGIRVLGGGPKIYGGNAIENNTAPSGGYGLHVTGTSYFEVYGNNTFKNNSVAGIYLGAGSQVRIRDNNTIAYNGQYGIWMDSDAVIFDKQVWWNDIWGNGDYGLYVEADPPGSEYFHAECNWWSDDGGPYDWQIGNPDTNDNPDGEPVSDYFRYRDPPTVPPAIWRGWLEDSSLQATSCKGDA